MAFPVTRLRRLRESDGLRRLVSENALLKKDLIQPLFVKEGLSRDTAIASMPGQFQFSAKGLIDEVKKLQELGVPGVILFGIPDRKDLKGRQAFNQSGVIQKSIAQIKKTCKSILVITDICLCEYLSHGHCGHTHKGRVLNDPTLETLAKIALSHARAGADVVAPSDMMDGRVAAIRGYLDKNHFNHIPILSYAVKYASSFYAPFREAAESAPGFGDRKSYQMDAPNAREALREAAMDVDEGADMLLVKPALAYGDIVYRLKQKFALPVGCYSVSGEYAMIKAAAQKKYLDEKKAVMETHVGFKRAGADFILTYWAKDIARWNHS